MSNIEFAGFANVEYTSIEVAQLDALIATATRLRGLLRECNNIMPACPKCNGNLKTWQNLMENKTIRVGHAEDCELAKELADD